MKVKTAELTGLALDWALADALELEPEISRPSPYDGSIAVLALPLPNGYPNHHKFGFFHTDSATCMGLTDRINIMQQATDGSWRVAAFCKKGKKHKAHGETLPEAVARCVVAMRLGDEVDVPDELGVKS